MTTYKINWTKEIPILLLLLIPLIVLLVFWSQLPAELPAHWNSNGDVDGHASTWMLAAMNIGMYLLLLFLPFVDPRKKNYALFNDTYWKIRFFIVFFMSILLGISMAIGLGYDMGFNRIIPMLVCLLFIFLGNLLGNIRPNWFLGIRTPWTLDNEEVWKKTHRMAGKLWVATGLLGLIASLILPLSLSSSVVSGSLMTATVVPVIYSFVIYRKLKKNPS